MAADAHESKSEIFGGVLQVRSCISVNGFVDLVRIYIPLMLRNAGRYLSIMHDPSWRRGIGPGSIEAAKDNKNCLLRRRSPGGDSMLPRALISTPSSVCGIT